jgi:KDO2-lipid IV(A) lauroyltransferase
MWVLYGIADLLFILAYYIVGYRKKVVMQNLINSFPQKSQKELNLIAKSFYKNLSNFSIEVLKSFTISATEINKRISFVNIELVNKYYGSGQSLLVLATHQFNWEWALLAGCLQLPYPVDVIYQKLASDKFDDLMFKTRSKFGGTPIKKGDALREIIRRSKQTRLIVINGDQTPPGRVKSDVYWAEFLHQDTPFYKGPGVLPIKTGMPVLFLKVSSPKRGYYKVEFVPLGEPPYKKDTTEILDSYIAETEKQIKEIPDYWLWSHKRWKRKRVKEKI